MPADTFTAIAVARILRPRGVRGEVTAEILTDFPERLLELKEVWLADGRAAPRPVPVRRCRLLPGRSLRVTYHFAGCDSVEAAERLRGCEVQVPIQQRKTLPDGSYYVSDLAGCAVWEEQASSPLGSVREVQFPGGVPLLAVDTADGELLVPLASDICTRIDVAGKRIDVSLPEGLRDLNRK